MQFVSHWGRQPYAGCGRIGAEKRPDQRPALEPVARPIELEADRAVEDLPQDLPPTGHVAVQRFTQFPDSRMRDLADFRHVLTAGDSRPQALSLQLQFPDLPLPRRDLLGHPLGRTPIHHQGDEPVELARDLAQLGLDLLETIRRRAARGEHGLEHDIHHKVDGGGSHEPAIDLVDDARVRLGGPRPS